jgi:hypothetical protein
MMNEANSNNCVALSGNTCGVAVYSAGEAYDIMSDIQATQDNTATLYPSLGFWHGAVDGEDGTEISEPSHGKLVNHHNIADVEARLGLDQPRQQTSHEYVDNPDLWQAPITFDWEQWAAFVSKFPSEQCMDIQSTI